MRGVFRSTWFSAAVVVWYALVAMPALPMIQFGAAAPRDDTSCATVCACASCSGGDACCCAPKGDQDSRGSLSEEDEHDGPAWKPVDCAKKLAWLSGLKAPTLTSTSSVQAMTLNTTATLCVVDEQAIPAEPIGVPEPPPRVTA